MIIEIFKYLSGLIADMVVIFIAFVFFTAIMIAIPSVFYMLIGIFK